LGLKSEYAVLEPGFKQILEDLLEIVRHRKTCALSMSLVFLESVGCPTFVVVAASQAPDIEKISSRVG